MTPRFNTVVVHFGMGKTGTSAIQRALLRRTSQLELDCRMLFPRVDDDPRPFHGNHSLVLRSMSSERPESLRFNIAAGLGSAEAVRSADDAVRAGFQRQFEATDATTLLLSAEGIGHFDDEGVNRLAAWLLPLGKEIRLLAWIRHPQHALAAEIQQRVKTGARLERLYEQPPCYRYRSMLTRLANAFGKPAIELYDYAESIAPGSSAVKSFYRRVGINLEAGVDDEAKVNVGLSHRATLLLDAANRLRPLIVDGKRNPLRRPNDLAKIFKVEGEPYAPPPAVYDRLAQIAQPQLEWMQRHYNFAPEPLPPRVTPREHDVLDQQAIDAQAIRLLDEAR